MGFWWEEVAPRFRSRYFFASGVMYKSDRSKNRTHERLFASIPVIKVDKNLRKYFRTYFLEIILYSAHK